MIWIWSNVHCFFFALFVRFISNSEMWNHFYRTLQSLTIYLVTLTDGWICPLSLSKTYYICGKWRLFSTKIINLAQCSIGFDFGCPNRCFWSYFMMWFFHQKVLKISMDLFCSKYDHLCFFCDYFSEKKSQNFKCQIMSKTKKSMFQKVWFSEYIICFT